MAIRWIDGNPTIVEDPINPLQVEEERRAEEYRERKRAPSVEGPSTPESRALAEEYKRGLRENFKAVRR